MWNSYAASAHIRQVASLKPPLLLSIIKIIESGLEVLLRQAASAVCSARRKSDCFPCPFWAPPLSVAHTISSILTFVTSHSFLHLLSYISCLLSLMHAYWLSHSSPNSSHMKHSCIFTFVTQSFIYI